MAEIRIALNTTNPNPGNNEIVLYPTSNAGGELNVMGPDGQPKRLLTDLTTLNDITVSGALNKTGTSNQPNINLSNATTTSDGAMSRFDKEFLDNSTSENTANQLVKRDNSGNFAAGTITASLFEGPSSSTQLIPSLMGAISSDGTSNNTVLSTNIIDNTHIKTGANIALSKLAVNPVDRSNHTGSQSYTTIFDFDSGVDNYLTNNKITTSDISSTAGILMSQLEKDPSNRATHFGPNPASALEDLPTEVNPIINNYLVNNPITNQEIETGTIEIGKLAFDPLDRDAHTGTQLASTISNFTDEARSAFTAGTGINIVEGEVSLQNSEITSVGIVSSGNWQADVISTGYGGTGASNKGEARNNLLNIYSVVNNPNPVDLSRDYNIVVVNATTENKVLNLPTEGKITQIVIKKVDSSANTVTITTSDGRSIDGQASIILTNQYDAITLVKNSIADSSWYILSKYSAS